MRRREFSFACVFEMPVALSARHLRELRCEPLAIESDPNQGSGSDAQQACVEREVIGPITEIPAFEDSEREACERKLRVN